MMTPLSDLNCTDEGVYISWVGRNPNDPVSLQLEAPLLIDPITDQARLISYERDEDGCMAVPAAGIDDSDKERALRTIEILGLNIRDRLNEKRMKFWDDCMMAIADYQGAQGPQVLKVIGQAKAVAQLKTMTDYKAEFSSVVEACIRKRAPEPLMAQVFAHA